MAKDLKKLAYEQELLASGNKTTDTELYGDEFGDDDDLEAMIKQTHDEIDGLEEDEDFDDQPEFDYDAYETLSEIENYMYVDKIDEVNEVLLFENLLTQLQGSNSELFNALQAAMDDKLRKSFAENVEKVKAIKPKN